MYFQICSTYFTGEVIMVKKFFFLVSAFLLLPLSAQVVIAPVFKDNMVLQRDAQVPVWGSAAPGETVTVTFAGQTVTATAGSDGKWMLYLAPMSACKVNRTLTVSGKENTITINNCLVGEVWLCSGQSNMEMPMWTTNARWRATNGERDVVSGANPLIRIMTVRRAWGGVPQDEMPSLWQILDTQNGLTFSAVAFYFGQELFKALDVPVGLVVSAWGGTIIEPWIPPQGYASMPQFSQISQMLAGEYRPRGNHQPATLFNRMIYPFVNFKFRGVIWYQGCSNLDDGVLYKDKMQALLNGWREVFNDPEMPFYFVQLAPCGYSGSPYRLPVMWETQTAFAVANENNHVGMAVINDAGDVGNIHPANKRVVGNRLARLALRYTYGHQEVKADSPLLTSWKVENGKFILDFKNIESWQGTPDHFEIAGRDGKWVKAQVEISGTQLIISAPGVDEPVQMRYLWHQALSGVLFNEAGLPLSAFSIPSAARD